jgi:iron complex transport system substrate-binding protein
VGRVGAPAGVLAAALVLALVAATGCGERAEPTGPAADLYPVTVANSDRPLVILRPPRRIAVLDPAAGEILAALGAARRVAGFPVARSGRIRLSRLRALRPDLIVAGAGADEEGLSRAAAASGAPVYVAPGRSLREVERAISQLGLIAGRPLAARRLVARVEAARRLVARRIRERPRVPAFVDLGLFTTASDQSLLGDLLREAGGANVAADVPAGVPVDLRLLRARDPAVYIALSDTGTTLATLRRNPLARHLRAVRSGRVVVIDSHLLEPGPKVGRGLLELARALHPDVFR